MRCKKLALYIKGSENVCIKPENAVSVLLGLLFFTVHRLITATLFNKNKMSSISNLEADSDYAKGTISLASESLSFVIYKLLFALPISQGVITPKLYKNVW